MSDITDIDEEMIRRGLKKTAGMDKPQEPSPKQRVAALLIAYLSALQSGPGLSRQEWDECHRRKQQLAADL